MSKVEISHVENGYIVSVTKMNLDGRPKTEITVHLTFNEVVDKLRQERI